jgi:tetratricopeptide (TPR) repeat protein
MKGYEKDAEEAYNLALKFTPNYSSPYCFLGELYYQQGDCSRAIEYQMKAFHMENNSFQKRNNLISLWSSLNSLGFYEESKKYADKIFDMTSDSSFYYQGLISADLDRGNYESALESALKIYLKDTNYVSNIWELGYTNLYLRNFRESFRLLNRYTEIMDQQGRKIEPNYLFGWIYLENGYQKEAEYHLEGSRKAMLKIIEQNQPGESCIAWLNLTKIYSVLREKDKALESLRNARDLMKFTVLRVKDFKNCTMLDNIRNEPEFEEFIKEGEAKYQVEHVKVEKLLKEKGILSDLP